MGMWFRHPINQLFAVPAGGKKKLIVQCLALKVEGWRGGKSAPYEWMYVCWQLPMKGFLPDM